MLSSNPEGLLLIGHGTRDDVGTRQFFELASEVARLAESKGPLTWASGERSSGDDRAQAVIVEPCLLELQPPTIEDGWKKLVAAGVSHIHVSPLLLFSAGHAKQDIPDAIAGLAVQSPNVTFDFARPLSRHPGVVDLAVRRVSAELEQLDEDRSTVVLMVGRGSYDPCARSDMFFLSEVVHRRLTLGNGKRRLESVETAFYAMAQPRLTDVLQRVAEKREVDQIVVYPHLLFEGRLNQAIHQQVRDVAVSFPATKFRVAAYLGPEEAIASGVWDRAIGACATQSVG